MFQQTHTQGLLHFQNGGSGVETPGQGVTIRSHPPKPPRTLIMYLLTKLGRAGWENIWLKVMAYGMP